MTLVAGIDSSTQSCKVVIHDLETGRVVRTGRASHPAGTEIDPAQWWDALTRAIHDAGGLDDVAAVSVAAQQHGMVLLDSAGRVIRPALLWNDTRSAPSAADLVREVGADAYAARTGVVPVAAITASKLRWIRDAEPASAHAVAAVALPHDWLTWRLRGYGPADSSPLGPALEALTTDRSDASGTGYWSPSTGGYDLDLFELALGRLAILPRVLSAADSPGTTPGGAVVGAGAGDNAGAALGLGLEVGDVVVSLGTSGTVFAVADAPRADPSGTVAGFADATGRFLPLVCTLNAAQVVDATARLLNVDHAEFSRLALAAEPGAGGVTLVPYFEGERTPNLPDATGSIFGLTLRSTTRENLARAAVEGMLCGLADGLDALVADGTAANRILLIGGGARSDAARTIAAEVFDQPIEVPSAGEYVADGAAAQAAWALTGRRPSWTLARDDRRAPATVPGIRARYASRATIGTDSTISTSSST
ncbi:xylulokinase [Plantibacter sp. Mn2098]|uniref:xylulokinase n=1 Tax=Plantibacter sp. Mn2098 TaxID=3395266 RepID=UPI003BD7ADD6